MSTYQPTDEELRQIYQLAHDVACDLDEECDDDSDLAGGRAAYDAVLALLAEHATKAPESTAVFPDRAAVVEEMCSTFSYCSQSGMSVALAVAERHFAQRLERAHEVLSSAQKSSRTYSAHYARALRWAAAWKRAAAKYKALARAGTREREAVLLHYEADQKHIAHLEAQLADVKIRYDICRESLTAEQAETVKLRKQLAAAPSDNARLASDAASGHSERIADLEAQVAQEKAARDRCTVDAFNLAQDKATLAAQLAAAKEASATAYESRNAAQARCNAADAEALKLREQLAAAPKLPAVGSRWRLKGRARVASVETIAVIVCDPDGSSRQTLALANLATDWEPVPAEPVDPRVEAATQALAEADSHYHDMADYRRQAVAALAAADAAGGAK